MQVTLVILSSDVLKYYQKDEETVIRDKFIDKTTKYQTSFLLYSIYLVVLE